MRAFAAVSGPFLGIVEDDLAADPSRARFAMNLDMGHGTLKTRGGCRMACLPPGTTATRIVGFHFYQTSRGTPRFLCIYDTNTRGRVAGVTEPFVAFATTPADTTLFGERAVSLTGVFSEPYQRARRFAFAELGVYIVFSNGDGNPYRMHRDVGVPSIEIMPTVSAAALTATMRYFDSPVSFSLAATYVDRVAYAGFDEPALAVMDGGLTAGTTGIDPEDLKTQNNQIQLSRQVVLVSDPFVAGDIARSGYVAVQSGEYAEAVTALAAFQGGLVIFGPNTVFRLQGTFEDGDRLNVVARGIGCVAPETIRDIGGALVWLHASGVHLYDGQNIRRVSQPIDAIFQDRPLMELPRVMAQNTAAPSSSMFPVFLAREKFNRAASVHWPSRRQVWFAVPTRQASEVGNRLVLVWDYERNAWWYYGFPFPIEGMAVEVAKTGAERLWLLQGPSAGDNDAPAIVEFHEAYHGDDYRSGGGAVRTYLSGTYLSPLVGYDGNLKHVTSATVVYRGPKNVTDIYCPSVSVLPSGSEDDRPQTTDATSEESAEQVSHVPPEHRQTVFHDAAGPTYTGTQTFTAEGVFERRYQVSGGQGTFVRVGIIDGGSRTLSTPTEILAIRSEGESEGDARDQ